MTVVLALHAVVGCGILAGGGRLGRQAAWLAIVPPALGFAWLVAAAAGGVLDGEAVTEHVGWVPSLGLALDLRLDGFALLFGLLITGIGVLVVAFAARYLPARGDGVARLLGLLVLFAGSMLGVVVADNLLVLYGFWELTSVTSYLLIGNDHDDPKARAAALQALLLTSAGALAMLGGFVLLGQAAGTYRLSELVADPPSGTTVTVGLVLVLLGALSKSAQYPFHSWLPAAMVAPTPVSAYLHSATMVKAGVFLVARLSPAFVAVGVWRPTVVAVGLVTMIAAGLRALRQTDLKLLLAHGTVSQLGLMMVVFAVGTGDAVAAGAALVLAHALFKAALFTVVGAVDHQAGTRDLRTLPRLGAGWAPIKVAAVVAAASMAGVPLAFGFVAKDAVLAAVDDAGMAWRVLVLAGVVVGSVLTAAYSARFVWALLRRRPAGGPSPPPPAALLSLPALLLAALSLVLGVAPALADSTLGAAARSVTAAAGDVHLAVWHGVELPLVLSAVVLGAGAVLFVARDRLAGLLAAGARVPNGTEGYVVALRGLNSLADRTTAVVQSGSLPVYTGVILTTTTLLVGGALLTGHDPFPDRPAWLTAPGQLPVAVAVLTFAVAAAASQRRFSAALFLGAAGYTMAGLFVVQGAPDLALTQVAIETLTTVLFVLVLRRLPDRFEHYASPPRRVVRLALSLLLGSVVFALALASSGSRTAEPVSGEMVERSVPDGDGKNVVNVTLVDFRGIDTLGEITVLASAAIGAVALARAGRTPRRGDEQRAAVS